METRKFTVVKRLLHISEGYTAFSTAGRQHYEKWVSPCENVLKEAVEAEYKRYNVWCPTYAWLEIPSETSVEGSELEKFNRSDEASKTVIRARYSVRNLDEVEVSGSMPPGLSSDCPTTVRLDLRNHIIRMWYRDVRRRLNIYSALRDIPAKYHGLACAIYTQLVVAGAINVGAVPFCTPVTTKFARDSYRRRRVAVIGAGFAGLTVARQLRSFGIGVTILEARNRIGGRVYCGSEGGFSCNVDLGAMLITGVIQNPLGVIAQQTKSELLIRGNACQLFDTDGSAVNAEIDEWAEREHNATLDVTALYRENGKMQSQVRNATLGDAFYRALAVREKLRQVQSIENISDTPEQATEPDLDQSPLSQMGDPGKPVAIDAPSYHTPSPNSSIESESSESRVALGTQTDVSHVDLGDSAARAHRSGEFLPELGNAAFREAAVAGEPNLPAPNAEDHGLVKRLLRWHIANLEYGCAAPLDSISLMHWDQDDPFAFLGEHALVKNGFKALLDGLASGLERNIQLNTEVVAVEYSDTRPGVDTVTLKMLKNGEIVSEKFDAAVVTVPLGVLKSNAIKFCPRLPQYKRGAIKRLGCGGLVKVILEFDRRFWPDKDMFGNLHENEECRGEFYMFWNMEACYGKPILIGMVAGEAAKWLEQLRDTEVTDRAMKVLRRLYPQAPFPIATAVSRWGNDKHSRGVYTSVTVGSSGTDYDNLARPISNSVFFAGEHTCRKNPTTCGSAIISGLREAHRIVEAFDLVEEIRAVHARSLKDALEQKIAVKQETSVKQETPVRQETSASLPKRVRRE